MQKKKKCTKENKQETNSTGLNSKDFKNKTGFKTNQLQDSMTLFDFSINP